MTTFRRLCIWEELLLLAPLIFVAWAWFTPVDESIRDTPEVRRAMAAYHAANPLCAWCGGDTKVETHHQIPLWLDGSITNAANTNGMVSLCRKRDCHIVLGHAGNYAARAVTNVKAICEMRIVVERKKK